MNIVLRKRVKLIRALITAHTDMVKEGAFNGASGEVVNKAISGFISSVRADDKQHFISSSANNPDMISWAKDPDKKLIVKNRIVLSLARYIRRTYADEMKIVPDKTLEIFCRKINVEMNKETIALLEKRIKFLKGAEISKFYRSASTTSKSCMTGKCNGHKINLYELNTDKVQLLVFDNEVRALLWNCDSGRKVLDRAYPSNHHLTDLLRSWAKSKGYVLRANADQNIATGMIGLENGQIETITLTHGNTFPFMDTFRYGEINKKTIVCCNDHKFGNIIFSTDQGTYHEKMICAKCKQQHGDVNVQRYAVIINGDAQNVILCEECYASMFGYCHNCGNIAANKIIISQGTNKGKRGYCVKCVIQMQGFIKYNDCECEHCCDIRRNNKELLKQAKIKVDDDFSDKLGEADIFNISIK